MKHRFLFVASVLFAACSQNAPSDQIRQIAEETRQSFVPDKRVAHFQIDTIMAGQVPIVKGETTLPAAKLAFVEKMKAAGIQFVDSLAVLPSPALSGKRFGLVNVSVCNIRSKPKHSAELATQALLGSILRVWKKEGDFYFVQTPDGYLGWVDDGGFVPVDSLQVERWKQSERAICLHDYAFVHETADETSAKVTDLVAGNILRMVGAEAGFTKVGLPDGRLGFVKSDELQALASWRETRVPDAAHVIASAMELMGRPYLWGGTSGKGLDCSGFTKTAFFLNGLQLPRDASQQAYVGLPLEADSSLANLLPGDLLFFGRKATPDLKEKVSHVALYLGNGKIIHASDLVRIESLRRGDPDFNEDRLHTYIRCSRLIGQTGKNGVEKVADCPFY